MTSMDEAVNELVEQLTRKRYLQEIRTLAQRQKMLLPGKTRRNCCSCWRNVSR